MEDTVLVWMSILKRSNLLQIMLKSMISEKMKISRCSRETSWGLKITSKAIWWVTVLKIVQSQKCWFSEQTTWTSSLTQFSSARLGEAQATTWWTLIVWSTCSPILIKSSRKLQATLQIWCFSYPGTPLFRILSQDLANFKINFLVTIDWHS